eukprot:272587-Alexandrium_andersonii.AAC.1
MCIRDRASGCSTALARLLGWVLEPLVKQARLGRVALLPRLPVSGSPNSSSFVFSARVYWLPAQARGKHCAHGAQHC